MRRSPIHVVERAGGEEQEGGGDGYHLHWYHLAKAIAVRCLAEVKNFREGEGYWHVSSWLSLGYFNRFQSDKSNWSQNRFES